MKLGEKIAVLRTKCGYSQEYLAEQLNVSRQAVSKWELGTALPDADKVVLLANFFGVSTDYLLKEHIEINESNGLDRVVLRFLGSVQDMDSISKDLLDIMKDGVIDDEEKAKVDVIVDTLDSLTSIINEMKRKMNVK